MFVTQYRRKSLTMELLNDLHEAFADILEGWRCTLLEFGGESDHIHILVEIRPALNISALINNLKTASARRARNRFADHLKAFYWKPYFWHRAYDVGSVGGATLEIVRRYVESQGTKEKPRQATRPAFPPPGLWPRKGECAGRMFKAEPPAPKRQYNRTHQLADLIAAAQAIEDGKPMPAHRLKQLDPGTSMGGARPKTTIEDARCLWLGKFPGKNDRCNLQRIEYATLDLARHCGLNITQARLQAVGASDVLMLQRFDREHIDKGYLRFGLVSGSRYSTVTTAI